MVAANESPSRRAQAFEDARAIADALADTLLKRKVRDNGGRILAAACLSATICESVYAALAVASSPGPLQAKTIARGVIEAGLNLEITCNGTDGDYAALRLATTIGFLRFADQYLEHSQYSVPEADLSAFIGKRDKARADLAAWNKQNVRALEMRDRFERAPKMSVFRPHYALYCSSAHNDHRALAERHLRGDHIALSYPVEDDDIAHIFTVCCGVALNVFEFMPFFLVATHEQLVPTWSHLPARLRRIAGQAN
jgi:hypothetical protein